jgi:hypothetical protein
MAEERMTISTFRPVVSFIKLAVQCRANDGFRRPRRAGRRRHATRVELGGGGTSRHITKLAEDRLNFPCARDRGLVITRRKFRIPQRDSSDRQLRRL